MSSRRRELLVAAAVILALTALVTWPQIRYMSARVGAHDDPLFSIWRLAWVAHALATDPSRLFDGNIFHPARNTLTFSDAMALEGGLAAPLFWAGVNPILIYNLLLLAGFAASGLAMFILARHLVGSASGALVSAAIFTVAPYRIEHFMHLELQWTMWMPLTFWAIHRTIETRSWRHGALVGVFLWLQILSSVYYGVFLAIAAGLLTLMLLAIEARTAWRAVPMLLSGALLGAALTIPYARPYLETSRTIGVRRIEDIAAYSATFSSYLASPPQSLLWAWTGDRWGGPELNLFPGAVAIILAGAALLHRPRRLVVVYILLTLAMIELSLGLNGRAYVWLFDTVGAMHGLRSPSRFAIIACCAIALLAGFGARAIAERIARRRAAPVATVAAALTMFVAIDDATRGMYLSSLTHQPRSTFNVYRTVRSLGPGALLELPITRLHALPGREATYMYWSITHWQPLVNGYSGYYPPEFAQTVTRTENFPDDQSLRHLRSVGVRYVIVHRAFYADEQYRDLMQRIAARQELKPQGKYSDPVGEAHLFVLTP
jgi:hypothetical protein